MGAMEERGKAEEGEKAMCVFGCLAFATEADSLT